MSNLLILSALQCVFSSEGLRILYNLGSKAINTLSRSLEYEMGQSRPVSWETLFPKGIYWPWCTLSLTLPRRQQAGLTVAHLSWLS